MTEKALSNRRRRNKEEEAVEEESEVVQGKGRVTPGRRNQVEEERGNAFTRPLYNFVDYLSEVRGELDKVTWPTRDDIVRLTRIVIITLIIFSLMMGAISLFWGQVIAFGLNAPLFFVALFAAITVGAYIIITRDNSANKSLRR